VFSTETERFPQFDEVFCFQFLAVEERTDVARAEMRLLKGQLCRARECRRDVPIKSDVAERESVLVPTYLQSRLDDD